MKKIRIIGMVLMTIIMGVSFTSCNPDNKQEEATKKLVKFSVNGSETILKYDNQGHLIGYSDVYSFEDITYTDTYTYVWGDNTIEITLDINGESQEKSTLNLENGLASEINDNPLIFNSSFKYNSSNRLIECKNSMGTRTFEWNDDMLTANHNNSNISTRDDSYTYDKNYTTKGYNPLIPYYTTTDLLYVAHPELAGLVTQKLFDSESSTATVANKEYVFSYKYEYEFDEDGYVNKVIVRHNEEDCERIAAEYTMIWE